ncbi:hypothetical protein [Falsiroseomonas sp.]|uniref:hypothetical protein n=1 Tax=Falsiroseomonas sp. TaxID=2870721 RepID=UPI003569F346
MLHMLISVARAIMGLGTIVTILAFALLGAGAADGFGIPMLVGVGLGALVGLVIASVTFGIAAAIFDIQERTARLVELAESNASGQIRR